MAKQLQVQGGTMAVAGSANSLDVAVKVSDGATLTLAGTTSLNGTLSSVAAGDDASAASTALIAITGGKTTISGGGGGNGAFAGTIRVDQGAELSITSGHANVLTGTQGKVVVNGTLSIGNKEGVNTAETFYNVSGSGLITSAQTYTETTGDDGSTTSTGRPVTIDLSTTDAFSGSVTATAGQVKLSGGRTENTLNTITANGGNVVIDSSMSATTISTSGTSAVSVTADATLTHDLMTYSGSTISGSNGNFSMFSGGTVTGGTVTQIGQDGSGYKSLNSQLSGVHFVSKEGTESHLNNSANSLTDLTVNGTVRLTQKAAVTGSTNVGTNGKLYVVSEGSTLGSVSGAGTVSSSVNQSVTLARAAEGTASTFSGTLEATGNQMTVTSVGSEHLSLAGIKANGGSINVMATSGDAISGIVVSVSDLVIGAGSTVGVYNGSTVTETEEGKVYVYGSTDKKGSLTISGTGARLNADLMIVNTALTLDGVLTMGSTLTLYSGNTLSGSLLTGWTDRSQALTLFSGVDELVLNGTTATADKTYDASSVFSGMSGYNLVMTGGTGGQDYIVQLVQSTPSPEPTTATLSLLALMGLAARRRRRKV
ncbi:MAG: MYXO-CTERM sorting domain-containing protein [Akkermansia muciniphila]|nr:MYXO-CTERM sorting domain-containing protein [Akkermansia muciniphila]